MRASIDLSPLGTARSALLAHGQSTGDFRQEAALLTWLAQLREPLETQYNLEGEITAIAWELARWQPGPSTSERQALILLILLAMVQVRQGSTRIALRGQKGGGLRFDFANRLLSKIQSVDDSLRLDPSLAAELMEKLTKSGGANALIGKAGDFKPLVVAGDHLYLQKMLHLEDQFVRVLRRKLGACEPAWSERGVEEALNDVLDRSSRAHGAPIKLNDEQQQAVRMAVRSRMTIISGGPGTGKTTIVVSILRVLSRLGVGLEEIALAAPTGKAANRMLGAIQQGLHGIVDATAADRKILDWPDHPRTLHRLLGYSPSSGRFHHHENNRLAERIVIVDEASMIDLALMARLVRSLRDDASLILLGDARQLPSVEAGAVLRDLLTARAEDPRNAPPAVILEKSHRMQSDDDGSNLLSVARMIDQGEAPRFDTKRSGDGVAVERGSVEELKFQGVEFLACLAEPAIVETFLERWEQEGAQARPGLAKLIDHAYALSGSEFTHDDQEKLRDLFDYWESFRILCATRVLPTGSDRINEWSHRRALEKLNRPPADDQFIAGEPVMMQVNDYGRMIFNGDQGLILNVISQTHARPQPMAVFRRSSGFTAFHLESLRSALVLSYAMTVHKAQGSEFDRVALFLPDRDLPINTREILYTALTRARKSVLILGDREIFEAAITRTCERDSGIVEKLRA